MTDQHLQTEDVEPVNRAQRRAAERDKKRNPGMPVAGAGVKTLGRIINTPKSGAPQRRSGHR